MIQGYIKGFFCNFFVLMFHLYLDIQFQVFQISIHNGLGKDRLQYDWTSFFFSSLPIHRHICLHILKNKMLVELRIVYNLLNIVYFFFCKIIFFRCQVRSSDKVIFFFQFLKYFIVIYWSHDEKKFNCFNSFFGRIKKSTSKIT